MTCIATIDGGSAQARAELLFLVDLLLQLGDRAEPGTDLTGSLGFSDIFRHPALGAGDFIRVEKASVGLLKDLAALRVRALERMREVVKLAAHAGMIPPPGSEAKP